MRLRLGRVFEIRLHSSSIFREQAQAGFSLTEVIVASALLAMAVPLLVNLLPTSFLSLRKAQNLQAATSMALYRIDEVAFLRPRSGVDLRESIQVVEPVWPEGGTGHRLGRELTSCRWSLDGGVLLQMRTQSEFEGCKARLFCARPPFCISRIEDAKVSSPPPPF